MHKMILVAGAAALAASPAFAAAVAAPHGKHMTHTASKARSAGAHTAARGTAHAWGADGQRAAIVERDARGHPSRVSVDGQVYAVCTAVVTDSCINPRQAGLNFGNQPLDHWPGHPASEMHRR